MDLGIKGNTAIVTASSSGLGKASASALLKEGVNVVINGRNEEKLLNTAHELREIGGGEVFAVKGDLTKKEDIKELVEKTYQKFERIDHLVTSAGGPPVASFEETEDDDWYFAFDLLVMSVVRLVRESLDYLRRDGGGTIVNITSRSVKEAIDGLLLSNSVRMSVVGLMKTLSRELAPEIRANAILPGSHETNRIKNIIESQLERGEFDNYDNALDFRSKNIPFKRLGKPEELGDLVAFLSSGKSSYINGTAVVIDGGGSRSNL